MSYTVLYFGLAVQSHPMLGYGAEVRVDGYARGRFGAQASDPSRR
jgi:hypothetical protein